PDAYVGVDGRPCADRHLAADDAALLEQAAVLHGHATADDGPTKARVEADVGVIPDDRVRNLHARIQRGVRADDRRSVHPADASTLDPGTDQRRSVDAGA